MSTPRFTFRPGADLLPVSLSFLGGALSAAPIAMVGAVGRERGGEEATFLHMSMLAAGLTAVLVFSAARGARPGFPPPLDSASNLAFVGAGLGAVAILSARGLDWYYATSGLISVVIFLMITWSLVRLSLGLYFASGTLGQVVGSLVMEQAGAFGAPQHEITVFRAIAVVLIAAGVVVVRTGK